MGSLARRLQSVLADVVPVEAEADGALTVHHGGTLASLRVVTVADGLDLISLTQILAWNLGLTGKLRDRVAEQAAGALLGSVTLVEKKPEKRSARRPNSGGTADVLLRYNFPGGGLGDDALRTLVLLVLEKGADIRRALTDLPGHHG